MWGQTKVFDLVRVHVNGLFTHLQCGSKIVLLLSMLFVYGRTKMLKLLSRPPLAAGR